MFAPACFVFGNRRCDKIKLLGWQNNGFWLCYKRLVFEHEAEYDSQWAAIKNLEQQSVLALHRVRQGFVKARTAQANQIRGLLGEYGLIVPQGIGHVGDPRHACTGGVDLALARRGRDRG